MLNESYLFEEKKMLPLHTFPTEASPHLMDLFLSESGPFFSLIRCSLVSCRSNIANVI